MVIDTLLVRYEVVCRSGGTFKEGAAVGAAIDLRIVAEVLPCGVFCEIARVQIYRPSGKIGFTREQFADGFRSSRTGAAYPHDRIDTGVRQNIVVLFDEIALEGRERIEHYYYLVEARSDHIEHIIFVLIELKIVVALDTAVGYILRAGKIEAFAADARDNDDSRIGILGERRIERRSISVDGRFSYIERGSFGIAVVGRRIA